MFQIRTGYQKWIYRYISECSGQKNYGIHTKRVEFITDNVFATLGNIGDVDLTDANWGKHVYHPELPDRGA